MKKRIVRRRNPNARIRKVAARRYFQREYDRKRKVDIRNLERDFFRYIEGFHAPSLTVRKHNRVGAIGKRRSKDGRYIVDKQLPKRGKYQKGSKRRNPRQAKPDGYEGFYPVEQLKGQYVKRKADSNKVYRVSSYDREYRRWRLDDTTDISRDIMVKTGTKLFAGFTY